jgi:hypothetical protein
MPSRRTPLNQRELDEIFYFIDKQITSKQRFCSTKEIAQQLKMPYTRTEQIVNALISAGRLKVVYEIPKKVRLFAPEHIVTSFSTARPLIPWLPAYYFPEKVKLLQDFSGVQSQLKEFEQFESLLTSTGNELVNSVGNALKWLGFRINVTEAEGRQDIEFSTTTAFAIAEVKGLERHARIDELRQAVDYHLRKTSERGKNDILTILLVNHFRLIEPSKRDPPFSKEVLQAVAKNYQFISLVSTDRLYGEIGRCISSSQTKEDLQNKIMTRQLDYKPA